MRALLVLLFTSTFSVQAWAQSNPYHVFEYKVSKAHYATDTQVIPYRLTKDGRVAGDMMITNCTKHKKYISGIRISFKNRTGISKKREMFSLECDTKTNSIFISRVRRIRNESGDYVDLIDEEKKLNAQIGVRVPSSISFRDNIVYFTVGKQTFTQKLDFNVEAIELIGVGSSGIARFFDEDLNS